MAATAHPLLHLALLVTLYWTDVYGAGRDCTAPRQGTQLDGTDIRQYTAVSPCPPNMALTGTSCTAIEVRPDGTARQLNFAGGEYNCQQLFHPGAHFPHINSLEENNVFMSIRNAFQDSQFVEMSGAEGEIWLNLMYDTSLGKWAWQDDCSDLTWSNWEGGSVPADPNNACAVIKMDGTWRMKHCAGGDSSMIICQLEKYQHHCPGGCNAGACTFTPADKQFKCVCPMNFYGDTCDQTCGGNVWDHRPYGFSSTNYPSDASCMWVFKWPAVLTNFAPSVTLAGTIESSVNCEHDYVKISDGHTLLETLCGDVTGTFTGTPGKSLFVLFKSNSATEFPFEISKFDIASIPQQNLG